MILFLTACTLFQKKSPDAQATTDLPPLITIRDCGDGVKCHHVDSNQDGKIDIINYYRQRSESTPLLIRRDIDIDNDKNGQMDIISHFNDEQELEKEEIDLDYNGTFERTDHYTASRRILTEIDSNDDKKVDIRLIYEGGVVKRKEKDTNFDGNFDVFMRLNEAGLVVRYGINTDYDPENTIDERGP